MINTTGPLEKLIWFILTATGRIDFSQHQKVLETLTLNIWHHYTIQITSIILYIFNHFINNIIQLYFNPKCDQYLFIKLISITFKQLNNGRLSYQNYPIKVIRSEMTWTEEVTRNSPLDSQSACASKTMLTHTSHIHTD